ncbi:MAG: hypothetical protein M0R46_03805 [Candidatus Muirbacterium halophilum]|nr:hypothetical protein [Candidatus Muirbacterium halophilum]
MKKTIFIIISIILIITVIKFSAGYYLSNKFSKDVEKYASESLNTKVSIESISTDIFSNISINKIKVNEPQSESIFLTAGSIKCFYTFSQILKRNFIIKDIILEKININIQRFSNSTFNFQKFKNYVYNLDIFQGNKIYAAENSNILPDYIKIDDINAKKVNVTYKDPLIKNTVVTGDIDVNLNIEPLKAIVSGKLFEGEDLKLDIKSTDNGIKGDFSLKNINAIKYSELYSPFIDTYEIKINSLLLDIKSDFIFLKELSHNSEIIIKKLEIEYNLFKISMNNQKILIKDKDIIFENNIVSIATKDKLLGNITLNGIFKDFKEFKSKIKTEIYKNSILSIFGFEGQDIQIEKSMLEGSFEIPDISSPKILIKSDLNIPSGNYFFFTTEGQKVQFPFSNMKLKASMSDNKIYIIGNANILNGSLEINTVLNDLSELSMVNDFKINSISAEEFFKINKLIKFTVYGDLSGVFNMTGKDFDISTFEGKGQVELSKAVFQTMFIDKLLAKSSSNTLKDLPMKNIKADVFLKGEKISFGKITGTGSDVNVNGDGYVSIDTSMKFDVNFDILEPFIKKNNLDKFLSTEDNFKLEIAGTLMEPDVKSNIDDILKSKLKDIIKENKSEELDKLKDKAKDFFKKLF